MRCPRCGSENRPHAEFCIRCGIPLAGRLTQPQPGGPWRQPDRDKGTFWLWLGAVGIVSGAVLALCLVCGCLAVYFGPRLLPGPARNSPTAVQVPRSVTPVVLIISPVPTATKPQPSPRPVTATAPPTPVPSPSPRPATATKPPSPTKPAAPVGLEIGYTAPDFALQDLNGRTVRLSEHRGRPVVINFWATWCGPCRAEMPDLQAAYEANQGRGLVILAVDLREDAGTVRAFMQSNGLTFPALLDQGQVQQQYGIRAVPTSYFLDRAGVIRDKQVGSMSRSRIDAGLAKIF